MTNFSQVQTSNSIEMVKAAAAANVEQLRNQEVAMETSVAEQEAPAAVEAANAEPQFKTVKA